MRLFLITMTSSQHSISNLDSNFSNMIKARDNLFLRMIYFYAYFGKEKPLSWTY